MQVVDVDMDRDDTCPGSWQYIVNPHKLCQGDVAGCASAQFSAKGISYDHICGQARAYQRGDLDGFYISDSPSIDSQYVDGVSVTIGTPRKHVWTYAVGLSDDHNYPGSNCPCATVPGPPAPSFVGNDYYCESGDVGAIEGGYYLSDPLWDGAGCSVGDGCCARVGMPWFYRTLPSSANDDFEIRICKNRPSVNEDIAIKKFEIYVLSS